MELTVNTVTEVLYGQYLKEVYRKYYDIHFMLANEEREITAAEITMLENNEELEVELQYINFATQCNTTVKKVREFIYNERTKLRDLYIQIKVATKHTYREYMKPLPNGVKRRASNPFYKPNNILAISGKSLTDLLIFFDNVDEFKTLKVRLSWN